METPPRTDDDLLARWRLGDPRAGQTLVRRHFDELYGFFRNKVAEGVDDLVQRTFLACVEGRHRIEGASFRAYMFGAARNILRGEFRDRCNKKNIDPIVSTVHDVHGTSVTQIVAKRREHQVLLLALQRVPLRDQVLLELSVYGLRHTEIAAITEYPPETIRNRLFRARENLRKAVETMEPDAELRSATIDDLRLAFDEPTSGVRQRLHHELVHGEAPRPGVSA